MVHRRTFEIGWSLSTAQTACRTAPATLAASPCVRTTRSRGATNHATPARRHVKFEILSRRKVRLAHVANDTRNNGHGFRPSTGPIFIRFPVGSSPGQKCSARRRFMTIDRRRVGSVARVKNSAALQRNDPSSQNSQGSRRDRLRAEGHVAWRGRPSILNAKFIPLNDSGRT
jgi:hypothetical protein